MTQRNLFAEPLSPVSLELADAEVELRAGFLGADEASELFDLLVDAVPWRQDRLTLWGREHLVPRLHQWFGDAGLTYTWSGIELQPLPWIAPLCALRERLRLETGAAFNTVLANYYRDGADSVGWHADDEPELGQAPVIASISLGAERDFQLRHRTRKDLPVTTINLPHGSLLLMSGLTQRHWKHQLPRRKRVSSGRINLTFRIVRGR
ncbi:MAG: alkylated DNA repair dioxygenase AlkB [Gammaproteobacteria bacterium]|jgi:alkylated DNA repair dioxygenase AlkB